MRQITEYISNNIKNNGYLDAPLTPLKEDFVKFLESHGFEDITDEYIAKDINDSTMYLTERSQHSETPLFIMKQYFNRSRICWVRFCNCGKVNEHNPVLFCYVTDNGKLNELRRYTDHSIGYDITNDIELNTWEEFIEYIMKLGYIK